MENRDLKQPIVPLSQSGGSVSVQLSKELEAFYKKFGVDPTKLGQTICASPYRFVRLNPRYDKEETLQLLRNEVQALVEESDPPNVQRVPWLDSIWGFYAVPAAFSLSSSPSFRSGRIYGMDVSSGAGVAVLLTSHHDVPSNETKKEANTSSTATDKTKNRELRILDLCCSPGLKLLQMADFFDANNKMNSSSGPTHDVRRHVKLVGVDISKHRLDVCKSIVHKFFIDAETSGSIQRSEEARGIINLQLYHEDGTTFGTKSSDGNSLVFDSRVATEEMIQRGGKRKRMNKSARARERKRLRQIALEENRNASTNETDGCSRSELQNETVALRTAQNRIESFDYVLVDAECSTDGSLKHMKERIKESSALRNESSERLHLEENTMLTDPEKLAELVELQRNLLASGFRLLRDGGSLVYSTCSLSEDQNENVVKWLLQIHPDAYLIPIHFPSIQNTKFVADGSLSGTVRFYPNLLQEESPSDLLLGDGFFVAKIGKARKYMKT